MLLLYLETQLISPKFSLKQEKTKLKIENIKSFSLFTEMNKEKEPNQKIQQNKTKQKPPNKQSNKQKAISHNSLLSLRVKSHKLRRKRCSKRLNKKDCYKASLFLPSPYCRKITITTWSLILLYCPNVIRNKRYWTQVQKGKGKIIHSREPKSRYDALM